MAICPRCDEPLAAGIYSDVEVGICPECSGLLVSNDRLVPLLEGLGPDLVKEITPDTEIEPVDDPGGEAACPQCSKPMEGFGYLGTHTVRLDRCRSCGVLWLDPDELGVAALLHARTSARLDDRQGLLARTRAEGTARLARMTLAGAVANAIAAKLL